MDEKELKAAIKNQIGNAVGYIGGELSEDRQHAMRDYMGQPLGNEIEGRSKVISSDVQDVIESVMPDIIQVFTSSDKAVRFEPVGPEDESTAEQATDYINYIWNVDNPGFNIFHDWFKDALLQKNGIIKIWWDETDKTEKRKYSGLTGDQVAMLMEDEEVEIVEHDEQWPEEARLVMEQMGIAENAAPPEMDQLKRHSVTIKRTVTKGRVKVDNVPPEEFLISRRARSLETTPFCAHRTSPTQSDLIAAGYDKEQIESLPDGDSEEFNAEKTERFSDEEGFAEEYADKATREILVYECYMYVDWDDDGIAELRKINVAGPNYEILKFKDGSLDNEEITDHPFSAITPIRMPHKFFGRSLAELVQDIQYIKTSIWRQVLDNMYNVNNGRAAISNKVSLDDYLDNKVGAPIRVNTDNGDAGAHIFPIVTPPIGNHAFPLLEYMDTVRETRTGINRLSQGLDPDALKNTASGLNQLLGRSQQRVLLIAQVFANGGVKDAFRKILRLIVENQDEARTIRLRNTWVPMDPSSWNAEMDVTADVGLGRGTQDQQIATTAKVVEATQGLVELQGGINGPFVYAHHVKNAYSKFYEAVGIKSSDPFIADLTKEDAQQIAQQAQEAPPPPELQIEQAKAQLVQMKEQAAANEAERNAQAELLKAQLEDQAKQLDHGRTLEKIAAERELEIIRMQAREFDLGAKVQERALEAQSKAYDTDLAMQASEHKHTLDRETAQFKAKAAQQSAKQKPKKKAA